MGRFRWIAWCVGIMLCGTGIATPAVAQTDGIIEGEVTLRLKAPRRSAGRYPGGSTAARTIQQVPAVVCLQGRLRTLSQRDTAFAPGALAVQVGSTVRFPNEDDIFHNVFSYSAAERFDLGRYPKGESKEVVFDEPGVVDVYCEVHEFMRAVIVVTENPFHAVVDEGGAFRLEGVPPGSYTLIATHPDLDPVEHHVEVRAGETARIEVEIR